MYMSNMPVPEHSPGGSGSPLSCPDALHAPVPLSGPQRWQRYGVAEYR